MAYIATGSEKDYVGKPYKNAKGNTECVVFVQQVSRAPLTTDWKKGKHVKDAKPGDIPVGTAIATFDDSDKYPTDDKGKHAAIYLSHTAVGITVLDQWASQGMVKKRTITYKQNGKRSNDGDTFYVID